MEEIRVLSPCGAIGYGFPHASLWTGMERSPHVIAVDAGSTDPGPYYLGTGEVALSWQAQKSDLDVLVQAQQKGQIPLIVGSAGLSGSRRGVERTVQIIKEIAKTHGYFLKIAVIWADIEKAALKGFLRNGRVLDFEHPKSLTDEMIDGCTAIVGQMGPEPMNPDVRCTVDSVAVHTMYEKESPVELAFPGGSINLEETVFEAINDRAVKVSGTRYSKADTYTVKLEGATQVGYRSLFIAGVRDPMFISQVDDILQGAKAKTRAAVNYDPQDYSLIFHVYGNNGVMGSAENTRGISTHELGIVCEAVARTQEIVHEICSFAHGALLHYPFKGRKTIAGNLAFPYSPSDFDVGAVFEFGIYHLVEVENPVNLFPIEYEVTAPVLEDA